MATPVVPGHGVVRIRFLLLVVVVLLAPLHAMADPRGIGAPPEPLTPEAIEAQRVQRVADIKAWLPRLVGRFRYEGVVDLNGDMNTTEKESDTMPDPTNQAPEADQAEEYDEGDPIDPFKIKRAHGLGDCVAIGAGPGVHCVIDVTWQDEGKLAGELLRGEEPFLSPAMMLYGIDANAASIRYLQLDKDGLTETESAVIRGNTLRWVFYTGEGKTTRRVTRIHAPPNGRVVQTTIEIEELTPTGWRLRASIVFDGRRVAADATATGS